MLDHKEDLCLVVNIKNDLIWWYGHLAELCIEVGHFFVRPFSCERQWLDVGQPFRLLIMLKEESFIKEVKAVKWEAVCVFYGFRGRLPNFHFFLETFLAKILRLTKYFRFKCTIVRFWKIDWAAHHDKHFITLVPLTIDYLIFREVVELHTPNQSFYSVSIVDLEENHLGLQVHL